MAWRPPPGRIPSRPPGFLWGFSLCDDGDIVKVSEVLWGDLAVRNGGQEFAKGAPTLPSLQCQLDNFVNLDRVRQ